jgi:alkaline phosphatase
MVKAKRGETIVFSYIVFKSRVHRDRVNKRVMSDARMTGFDPSDMPVDMKRFGYAGFKTIVEATSGKAS